MTSVPLILIIEDDANVAALDIALDGLNGFKTRVLSDSREALRLLDADSEPIRAIVTDLNLPHIDGYELIAAIRSKARYLSLPVIVISGDSDPHIRQRLNSVGANEFFAKPYSPHDVRRKLKELIGEG